MLCFNSLQARDLTLSVLCWTEAWACWHSWSLMTVAPLERLYSIKTLAHLPPAPSQPIKEDCGLLLCISFVQCDCCVTCHCCFLSSFPRCPESFSLVISGRGGDRWKNLNSLCSHSHGEFSSLDFFNTQALDPHLNFLQSWTTRSGNHDLWKNGSFGLPGLWLTSFCWQTA